MDKIYLCIDIGGTKTAAMCLDEDGKELHYIRIETKPELGPVSLVKRIKAELMSFITDKIIVMGSIASPGPLDTLNGLIVHIPTMGFKDVKIVKLFSEEFNSKFYLLNDCSSGALGAWKMYNKPKNMLYVSLSTGVGGGLILNSKLYEGKGNAAEIGHLSIGTDNRKCACGKVNCLELYSSGSGISNLYSEKIKHKTSTREIAVKARQGDELALKLFDDCGIKVNYTLKLINTLLDLDMIVIGGGMLNSLDLFKDKLIKDINIPIYFLKPNDNQVLLGAYEYIKINDKETK